MTDRNPAILPIRSLASPQTSASPPPLSGFLINRDRSEMKDKSTSARMKVAILGEANVGKTALLNRFVFDRYEHDYKFTVGADFYDKTVETKTGEKVHLQIWDTAGHERFHSILPAIVKDANVTILVYDVTDESSFHHIAYWKMFVQIQCRNNPFLMIVGTKADDVKRRKVSLQTLRIYAGGDSYIETSAKTGMNVDTLFQIVASKSVVDCDSRGRVTLRLTSDDHSKLKKAFCGCS
ncbi:hypothetical protein L596_024215 [Steinernema carpocapsae]|uniref:Uncharacterized protein n=1 Tax=Steinernema carpocapsae TaxID=34508 RepID=A0A4U5MG20_STECR|nr:hypothetical protein L596_024215 [Steinernema carpocapsae]